MFRYRDVAQLGSALPWGGRGREFKSHRSDQMITTVLIYSGLFFIKKCILLQIQTKINI